MILRLIWWVLTIPFSLFVGEWRCRKIKKFYDDEFLPQLVQQPDGQAIEIDESTQQEMRSYSIRVAYLIQNYSRMVGGVYDEALALSCGVFGHLYDKAMDNQWIPAEAMQSFISDMRSGDYHRSDSDKIRLTNRVFDRICEKLPAETNPLFHETVDWLHDLQIESLKQRDELDPIEELMSTIHDKGSAATLIFCLTAHPNPKPEVVDAIKQMGAFFQLMDDFEDQKVDRIQKVRTAFTEGKLGAKDLRTELIAVIKTIDRVFPPSSARREFANGLISWYALAIFDYTFKKTGFKGYRMLRKVFAIGELLPSNRPDSVQSQESG